MEYIHGQSLAALVKRWRQLPVPEACELAYQAALGLQHAHDAGIIHRDIKADNLMLDAEGTLKILDMGLARWVEPPTNQPALSSGFHVMGTPDYMAPQQFDPAQAVDRRADIYALGCTLYQLLSGAPPFAGEKNFPDKMNAHLKKTPAPLPHVEKELNALVQKMLAKNPEDRHASAAEVARSLEKFRRGAIVSRLFKETADRPLEAANIATIAAQRADTIQEEKPRPRRSWLWIGIGAAVVLVLFTCILAGGIGLFMMGQRGPIPQVKGKDSNDDAGKGMPKAQPNADSPKVLINENFSETLAKKNRSLPVGWSGEFFRVASDNGEPCLEVSAPTGDHLVDLPPVKLGGNFEIEGSFVMGSPHKLQIRLGEPKGSVNLHVVITSSGQVSVGEKTWAPLPTFKPSTNKPTTFRVVRDGIHLKVYLNGEPAVQTPLPGVTEFESVRIGISGGLGIFDPSGFGRSRLYSLKVATLPEN